MDDFFKFPSTPHLALLDKVEVRDDKVLTESERHEFLKHEILVEEKVDGANLGISFDTDGNLLIQNRGNYLQLPCGGQWKPLADWLGPKSDIFFEHITGRYIVFGEWCYARHSVSYDQLPDWFLGFDVYDKRANRFFSIDRRESLLRELGVYQPPLLSRGYFTLSKLTELLGQSKLSNQPVEGLYLRRDKHNWLEGRAKLVRPDFIQSVGEHWSRSGVKPNRLQSEAMV